MKLLNRVLPVFICILLIFAFLPSYASAEAVFIDGGDFGENGVTWELTWDDIEEDEGEWTLIISGSGKMPDMSGPNALPWYDYSDLLDTIVVGEGVSSVGDFAFANCWHVSSVSLPQSLERIGTWGFGRCLSLSSIIIPSACAYIGGAAFQECGALSSIIVPSACSFIGDEAFRSCAALRSVTFEGNAPDIGSSSFYGVTAAAWCSCLQTGWDENTMLQYGAERLTWEKHVFDEVEILKEATCIDDGVLRKTCDRCKESFDEAIPAIGHIAVIDPAVDPDYGKDGLTEGSHCSVCGHIITTQEPVLHLGYIIEADEATKDETVEINGVPCLKNDNGNSILFDDNALFAISFGYSVSTAEEQNKQYPSSMKVYLLSYDDNTRICTKSEVDYLSDLLSYKGFSIRVTGVHGIRIITSIRESLKEVLVDNGIDSYKLIEYGTLAQWESVLNGRSLTFDTAGDNHAIAYSHGNDDKVFARYKGDLYYTNVIVLSSLDKCGQEIAMRPYMKFRNEEGKEMVIYGGTVSRSIGYIALQNKDAFKPGTKEYEYIWSLIRAAYNDEYAGSYKKS